MVKIGSFSDLVSHSLLADGDSQFFMFIDFMFPNLLLDGMGKASL